MNDLFICPRCKRHYRDPEIRCCPVDGSPVFRPESLNRLGQRLEKYKLIKVLDEGGMGVVYEGRHTLLDKVVAIKILHDRYAKRDSAYKDFLREAKAASRIRHPNIVDVTDFGRAPNGQVYLVMEHLEGISLDQILVRDRWIPLFNTVNIVRQLTRALAAAHDEGVVHLDLKPENIFLVNREGRRQVVKRVPDKTGHRFVIQKEDNFDWVKLVDFGVARFLQGEMARSGTKKGLVLGTPHYMSPEQAKGIAVDSRSDVYSLGILFYEMLTGLVPFDSDSPQEILNGHVYGRVPPPKDCNPQVHVDEGTNSTIMRCLEKNPARRYQSMDELQIALADCFTDQVFLRDIDRMPGAREAGILPHPAEAQAPARGEGPPVVVSSLPPLNPQEKGPKKKRTSLTDELGALFNGQTSDAGIPVPQENSTSQVEIHNAPVQDSSDPLLLVPNQTKKPAPRKPDTQRGLGKAAPSDPNHKKKPG